MHCKRLDDVLRAKRTQTQAGSREQQTRRAAEAAAREVAAQVARDAAAKSATNNAQAAEIAKLRLEVAQLKRAYDPSDSGEPTRSHDHMTTRPYVTT